MYLRDRGTFIHDWHIAILHFELLISAGRSLVHLLSSRVFDPGDTIIPHEVQQERFLLAQSINRFVLAAKVH